MNKQIMLHIVFLILGTNSNIYQLMTDINSVSTLEWLTILQALSLTKTISEIKTQDILGKGMESFQI